MKIHEILYIVLLSSRFSSDPAASIAGTLIPPRPAPRGALKPEGEEMVFYFKARPEAGDYTIFMGLDKHENEELIKFGFPEDIWFHVDKMSSAHVYVRLNKGQTIDDISEGLLEDCAQLVKANSIQGNKVNNVDVVYTPWYNLKKAPTMDVGQVGFHNSKMVRTVRVEKRSNEIINRLNKTKVERQPDFKAERESVSAAERAERKVQLRDKKRREEMDRLEKERQAEIRSYKGLMVSDKMTSNKQIASASKSLEELEDDFIVNAKNITGEEDEHFMIEWHEGRILSGSNNTNSSDRAGCWRSQPFCNFLMACLVIAFILPWFFRVSMF